MISGSQRYVSCERVDWIHLPQGCKHSDEHLGANIIWYDVRQAGILPGGLLPFRWQQKRTV